MWEWVKAINFFSFLAWLFWIKKLRYCHDPYVIITGVGIWVTNFYLGHISVMTEYIYLKPIAGSFGLYQEENATDRRDWNRKVNRTNFRN